jgi:hypothetical protein
MQLIRLGRKGEAVRNIRLKFPGHAAELAILLEKLVLSPEPSASLVSTATGSGLLKKDIPILAAAIASRAEVLVTNDRRHFDPLYGQSVQGMLLLTPADVLGKRLDLLAPPA